MEPSETKNALTGSWKLLPASISLLRQYFVPLLYVSILPLLVNALGSTLAGDFKTFGARTTAGIALLVVSSLWTLVSIAASYYAQLHAVQHRPVGVVQAYRGSAKYLLRTIGLLLLYGLLMLVGFLLLIVPGLIVLRRYYLAAYYLNDQDLSIKEAMRRSAQDSKPVSGYIWGIIGVSLVLALAGSALNLIGGGIGIIAGIALGCLYIFAPALRYQEIKRQRA